jgi:hypothetical protein
MTNLVLGKVSCAVSPDSRAQRHHELSFDHLISNLDFDAVHMPFDWSIDIIAEMIVNSLHDN